MPATSRANVHTVTTTGALTLDELDDWLNEAKRAGIPGDHTVTIGFDPADGLQLKVEREFDYPPRPVVDEPTAEVPVVPAIGAEGR